MTFKRNRALRTCSHIFLGAAMVLAWAPASAETIDQQLAERIARLDLETSRAESVRQVKRVQLAYAHYAQFGLWNEMAELFSHNGELVIGEDAVSGPAAIQGYLTRKFGGGRVGLAPGAVATRMQLTPVISLSPDGSRAKGRWHEVSVLGQLGESALWEGGISENEYILEDGRWKIARLHLYPMYAGTYETGWYNLEEDLPIVPFHYTPDSAGVPIPPLGSDAAIGHLPKDSAAALARLSDTGARLRRLAAEDAVFRLQNAYGYYLDQKMWTDITDLFTVDGTLEIAGIGIYRGEQGIRRSFGKIASNGLLKGEVNEHLQLETIVTVSPDGKEAWARGFQLGMLGRNHVGAWWTHAIFENRYVEQDGTWRIAEMRLFPVLRSDYYRGWGESQLPEPVPPAGYEPDTPSAIAVTQAGSWIPDFDYPNPGNGEWTTYPEGAERLGTVQEAREAATTAPAQVEAALDGDYIAKLETQLAIAKARDGTENVSHAFGYYLDDFNWDGAIALFARTGRRGKYQIGFYVGPERIREAELRMYGPPRSPRSSIQIHLRVQPVIDVGADGMTSKLRTRLFSFSSSTNGPGSFQSGMYPNDKMVMQDGVWKFQHQSIDELYFASAGYKRGWADVDDAPAFDPDREPTMMDRLRLSFPPDVLQSEMGIRGIGFAAGPDFIDFPDVKPMWFHYPNPVSGRLPPNYCPDHSTCYQRRPLFQDQEPTPAP